jgi:hypothetical protein
MPIRTTAALILAMIGIVLSGYALTVAAGVTLSAYVNYVGLALQVAGFLTVAVGLADIREKFTDQPSVPNRVGRRIALARRVAWVRIRRMIGRPVSPGTVQLSAAGMVTATATVTAQVLYGTLDLDRPVRDLLAQLDSRTRDIQLRVNGVESELGVEAQARESGDAAERTAREAADAGLDQKLSDLASGGLRLEWWGVCMFLLGTVLSTIPDELASWIG